MESLLIFNVPLPFGNVTVATVFLILVYIILTGLLQLGIELVSFTLGMDDKDSLIKKPKNILFKVLSKFSIIGTSDNYCYLKGRHILLDERDYSKAYGVRVIFNSYYYGEGFSDWRNHCDFGSESKAKSDPRYNKNSLKHFNWNLVIKICTSILLTDIFLLLLGIAFIPTISVAITLTTVFSVRMLSKKVWKNVAKGKQRLDGHDKDISEIKEKMGE